MTARNRRTVLEEIRVQDLRCIEQASLALGLRQTVISGDNGSGKTTLLEAIYCLGRGRSFRPARREQLVRHGQAQSLLFGRLTGEESGHRLGVGLSRGVLDIHIDGQSGRSTVDLALLLAAHVVEPDSHRLISAGPEERRRFLDFGVFHVEHAFLDHWRAYRRVLAQRNAALRQAQPASVVGAWDAQLLMTGGAVDAARRAYLDVLQVSFSAYVERFFDDAAVAWEYRPGWNVEAHGEFHDALQAAFDRDCEGGVTTVGPHRADLKLTFRSRVARHQVSRGQQKMIALALILAQHEIVATRSNAAPMLLLDDPAAELDGQRLERLFASLERIPGQVVISALDGSVLPLDTDAQSLRIDAGKIVAAD